MRQVVEAVGLAFIPLFVAIDILGVLPIFLGLTEGLEKKARQTIIRQILLTASGISIGFILVGEGIFWALGITASDFKVGGGTVLLVLAVYDILHPGKPLQQPTPTIGVVPIGTPLIAGPAVLTTLMILGDLHGYRVTLVALVLNLLVVWLVLWQASSIARFLGDAGSKAFSKVASLLLAAIAVMMIRTGLSELLKLG